MILEALAISAFAETICRSKLFRPIQRFYLLKCSYCFAHYLAFLLAGLRYTSLYDFIINWFALVTLSIPGMLLIELLFKELEDETFHDSQDGAL